MSVKYRLQKRAEQEQATRRRIVETAVELHAELGPSSTSVVELARRAGVSRPTIYRHFPDQRALLAACSSHARTLNPAPDPTAWAEEPDADERLALGLGELFAYYAANERLLALVLRDAETDPLVREAVEPRRRQAAESVDVLLRGWPARGARRRRLRAALAHATAFATWRSLVRGHGLTPEEAIGLLRGLVRTAAA